MLPVIQKWQIWQRINQKSEAHNGSNSRHHRSLWWRPNPWLCLWTNGAGIHNLTYTNSKYSQGRSFTWGIHLVTRWLKAVRPIKSHLYPFIVIYAIVLTTGRHAYQQKDPEIRRGRTVESDFILITLCDLIIYMYMYITSNKMHIDWNKSYCHRNAVFIAAISKAITFAVTHAASKFKSPF